MVEKYPHDALVRAWLDGKTIQYLDQSGHVLGGVWVDIEGPGEASKVPHLYRSGTEYRIKPVTVRYRVALMAHLDPRDGVFTTTADNLQEERELSKQHDFVRWLTDWTEVVV
jgi:hypothetical protein